MSNRNGLAGVAFALLSVHLENNKNKRYVSLHALGFFHKKRLNLGLAIPGPCIVEEKPTFVALHLLIM